MDLIETENFSDWLGSLRDREGRVRIARRISRLADGNLGDAASVGSGVSELRLDFGPGYRVYFGRHGAALIVLLAGGDKASQPKDIKNAHALWRAWKEAHSGKS